MEKRNSWPYRDSNSDSSDVQPVASRYADYAIPALCQDSTLWHKQLPATVLYSWDPNMFRFVSRTAVAEQQVSRMVGER
jgi:hypothetical protein